MADKLSHSEWERGNSSVLAYVNLNNHYEKSANGNIIIPVNNKLVYTDTNTESVGVSKIIEFDSEFENEIDEARRIIYEVEKRKSEIEDAYEIIEETFGIGFVNESKTKSSKTHGRYDRRTERGKSKSDSYHANFLQERIRSANEIIHSVNNKNADNQKVSSNDDAFFGAKFSISDTEGKQLSKGQQEYFKDSKMRDENGNLKVMYHGSEKAGFHEFSTRMSDDEISFFFTDDNEVAKSYSGTHENYAAIIRRTLAILVMVLSLFIPLLVYGIREFVRRITY